MLALYLAMISTTLARGDTIFIETDVPLGRAPSGIVEATVTNARSSKEVKLAPYVEVLSVSGKTARISYAVRAASDAAAGNYRLFAIVELKEKSGPLGTAQLDQTLELIAPAFTKSAIDAARKSYLSNQEEAAAAYELLRSLHDLLRLDRADPPPNFARVQDRDLPVLQKFLHHRLRADVELKKLRTAVDAADPAIASAALLAIGALSKRPTGTVAKASAIEGETIGRSLELATIALNDARIDEAEAYLDKLSTSGRLDRLELAQTLVLLGAIYVARGRAEDGARRFGQALCVSPALEAALGRALYKEAFAAAKTAPNRCTSALAISAVTATRVEGKTILMRATFGPDPHQLIGGGDVEVWGSGGGVHRAEKVRASHTPGGANTLEATIEDTGDLQAYDGQLLLRVLLRDVSGVVIATFGDPDPTPVPLAGTSSGLSLDIPWWGWAAAIGVVVVAAGTTAIVLSTDRDVVYGIGPIHAEF